MKYLFTYNYSGKLNGMKVDGFGSCTMSTADDSGKITEELIYGSGGTIESAKKCLEEQDIKDANVCPMGWFKFDE